MLLLFLICASRVRSFEKAVPLGTVWGMVSGALGVFVAAHDGHPLNGEGILLTVAWAAITDAGIAALATYLGRWDDRRRAAKLARRSALDATKP